MEIASFQITSVEIGDFQFAARRRGEGGGMGGGIAVVEIKAGHRIVGPGFFRLFLDRRGLAFGIERYDAICARRSEEHTSELQPLMRITYALFYSKQKNHD